jgi:hypothetical protein
MDTIAVESREGEREDWRIQVKDLCSLCGTLIDGRTILPDVFINVRLNAVVTFGLKERLRLVLAPGVRLINISSNGRMIKKVSLRISDLEDAKQLARLAPLTWHKLATFATSDISQFRLERVRVLDEEDQPVAECFRYQAAALTEAAKFLPRLVQGYTVIFEFEQNAVGWCLNDSAREAVKLDKLLEHEHASILEFICFLAISFVNFHKSINLLIANHGGPGDRG